MYIDSCREASLEGYLQDVTILFGSPWGFSVRDIRTPTLIWHGELDRTVPPGVAHWIARQLPDSDLRLDANGGHLIVHTLGTEILTALHRRSR